jgi:hypothetical protein
MNRLSRHFLSPFPLPPVGATPATSLSTTRQKYVEGYRSESAGSKKGKKGKKGQKVLFAFFALFALFASLDSPTQPSTDLR